MAYIRDINTAFDTTDVSTHTAVMPQHQTDDILLWVIAKDTNAGGDFSTPSGWTSIIHQGTGTQIRVGAFYKVATSSSETAPATTSTDTDAWGSYMISIADADTADVINGSSSNNNSSSYTPSSPALTTDEDGCLVIYFLGSDCGGATVVPTADIGVMHENSNPAGTTVACGLAWSFQETAGAVATPGWKLSAGDETNGLTIAINNKSGGGIPAFQSPSNTPATYLISFDVSTYTDSNHGFTAATAALSLATIGSKTAVYSTTRGSNYAYGCDNYSYATGYDSNTQGDLTSTQGLEWAWSSAKDLSTGLVACTFVTNNPEDARSIFAKVADGGMTITFLDSSDNYRAFNVYGKDNIPDMVGRITVLINVDQSDTDYATSATPPTLSDIDTVIISATTTVPGTSAGAVARIFPSEMHKIDKITPVGGSSGYPMDIVGIYKTLNSFRCQLGYLSGSAALLSYAPIQIGDGTITTYADIKNSTLQFPRIYSVAEKQITYHGQADDLGISYYGVTGDTIKHRNSIVSSPSQYYWKIHASATSAATWDFSGLTIVGANVTLRDVCTFDSMAFTDCTAIDASDCDLTSCTISGLTDSGDLTVSANTTFNACHFNTTALAASEYMVSTASPSIFTSCHFIGSSTTGHAIRITTAGTYSFSGNEFTGYGADASNSAAIFNDSGGAVTINVTNGGDTPTYKNGTSASTTINNAVDLTITVVDEAGSPIETAQTAIFKVSDGTQLMNEDTNASGIATESFSYVSDTAVTIRVRKSTTGATRYFPYQGTGTITSSGLTTTVTLIEDTIAS